MDMVIYHSFDGLCWFPEPSLLMKNWTDQSNNTAQWIIVDQEAVSTRVLNAIYRKEVMP